jgi:phosphoglycolate phosphatase-like HAD superfamily hydrolase
MNGQARMRALALDFDGVICESAREAYRVALTTYRALVAPGFAPGAERDEALYEAFLALMPLGNRAEDYAIALAALEQGRSIPDQTAYDAFRGELDERLLQSFHRRFYSERDAWRERDLAGWLAELRPYPGICALLRRHAGEVSLCIATAKDRRSVHTLLASYGIADLFPEGTVLDKETGVSKREHLLAIARRSQAQPEEVTFVDDKVNHLEDVAGLGVRCVLAAWGYNGARERAIAAQRGFLVCELPELEPRVFGPTGAPAKLP